MNIRSFLLFFLFLPLLQSVPSVYYVAPYGTAVGDGSPERPKTFASTLCAACVPSGSTVWLIPGTYQGSWSANAAGVTYRSVPGTRAKLDGSLTINSADTTFQDLEILNTSWLTRTGTTMPQIGAYVGVFAPRVKILNSYIHDLGRGIEAFNGAGGATADLLVRGCLLYNIGWQDTGGVGHGHGVYAQNDDAGRKVIQGNTILNNYGYAVQFYGSSTAQIRHLDLIGNTFVNQRVLLGGGQALVDIHVRDNRAWQSRIEAGYSYSPNEDAEISGNTIGQESLQVLNWKALSVHDNRIATNVSAAVTFQYPTVPYSYTWNLNSYWFWKAGANPFGIPGEPFRSFSAWQTRTGFDAQSAYQASAPSSAWVYAQPNADDPNRGLVTIYNWPSQASVNVDLTSLALTPGASYRLVNAANPTQTFSFVAGVPVSVPMNGWSVATPIGASAPLKPSTAPAFMVFLVEPI